MPALAERTHPTTATILTAATNASPARALPPSSWRPLFLLSLQLAQRCSSGGEGQSALLYSSSAAATVLSGPARRGCPDSRVERMLQHSKNKTLQFGILGLLRQRFVADDQNWATHNERVSALFVCVSLKGTVIIYCPSMKMLVT